MKSFSNILTLLLALAGCVVAIVLTYEEFHPKADIGCTRFGGDCAKTISSAYGHVGPIPTSVLGLGMYMVVAGLSIARMKQLRASRAAEIQSADTYAGMDEGPEAQERFLASQYPTLDLRRQIKRLDGLLWIISTLAVITSWWLQYVSLFVINSFCPWCFTSALLVTLLFALTSYDFLLEGRKLDGEQKLLAGVTAFIVLCFAFVFGPGIAARISMLSNHQSAMAPQERPLSERDIIIPKYLKLRGDPKAQYTMIEFADYQCPHCKKAAKRVEELLKHPPAGGIRFGFRNFPLPQHPWATQAAIAAEAAGEQGKFWQMHDLIFEHQDDMDKAEFDEEQFNSWAGELGLDVKRFKKDRESEKIRDRVVNDKVAGDVTRMGVTPSFFLVTPTQINIIPGIDELEQKWRDPKDKVWK